MSNAPISLIPQPEGYADLLTELKTRIITAQHRASLKVNRELILLYWQIEQDILRRQAVQGWESNDSPMICAKPFDFLALTLMYMRAQNRADIMLIYSQRTKTEVIHIY